MPRENTRTAPGTISRARKGSSLDGSFTPQARPVSTFVTPAQSAASELAEAFKGFAPGLTKYLEVAQANQNIEAGQRGTTAAQTEQLSLAEVKKRVKAGTMKWEQSRYFQDAYMAAMAHAEATRAGAEVTAQYENSDKDNINPAELFRARTATDLEGLNNPLFASTYAQVMAQHQSKVSAADHEHKGKVVAKNVEGAANSLLVSAVKDVVANKDSYATHAEYKQALYTAVHAQRKDAREFLNIPYSKQNKTNLDALSAMATQLGDSTILEVFDMPSPDGTPSLAMQYPGTVQQAKDTADTAGYTNYVRQHKMDDDARKKTSESVMADLLDDHYKGQDIKVKYNQLKEGLTQEDRKFAVKLAYEDDFRPNDVDAEAKLEYEAYTGRVGFAEIRRARLTNQIDNKATTRLLNVVKEVQAKGVGIAGTRDYQNVESTLTKWLTPGGLADFDKAAERRRANALMEFYQSAQTAKNTEDLWKIANNIKARYVPADDISTLPLPQVAVDMPDAPWQVREVELARRLREKKLTPDQFNREHELLKMHAAAAEAQQQFKSKKSK